MRNKDKWRPSKYVYKNGRFKGSRNPKDLGVGSRLVADIVANFYDTYIPKFANGMLIDLGCGYVPLFELYKDYVSDNVCVDWPHSLHKNAYLDIECDLTNRIPFKDGSYNTIVLSDVLEHIVDPNALWEEMSRLLAPKGVVFINVPFFTWLHEVPYDYYRYTEYALRQFAERNGFRMVLLKAIGGSPEVLTDIIAKHVQFVPLVGRGLADIIQTITHIFLKIPLVRKISEKSSKFYPLGYFLVVEKYD